MNLCNNVQKVAIIGGAGFIGSNIALSLSKNNYIVKVLDRTISKATEHLKNITFIFLDINDTNSLLYNTNDCDTVIWLVHTSVPGTVVSSVHSDFVSNVPPLIRFLEGAKLNSCLKKFIFFSSGGTIYGNTVKNIPIKETCPLDPISVYGLTKLIAEEYIEFLTKNTNFESLILRPSNVYGIYQNLSKPQGIIGHSFKSIITNASLELYNGGRVIRDFIYVSDIGEAVIACLHSDYQKARTRIYNIGSEIGFTIQEIIDKVCQISKRELNLIHKDARTFDCEYNVLDCSCFQTDMGWKPQVDLQTGLQYVWEWIKNEKNEI